MKGREHDRTRSVVDVNAGALHVDLPDLATPNEVAGWLKISRKAVYARAERGTLPGATYIGRRLYFIRSVLRRCVEQGRVPETGDSHGR